MLDPEEQDPPQGARLVHGVHAEWGIFAGRGPGGVGTGTLGTGALIRVDCLRELGVDGLGGLGGLGGVGGVGGGGDLGGVGVLGGMGGGLAFRVRGCRTGGQRLVGRWPALTGTGHVRAPFGRTARSDFSRDPALDGEPNRFGQIDLAASMKALGTTVKSGGTKGFRDGPGSRQHAARDLGGRFMSLRHPRKRTHLLEMPEVIAIGVPGTVNHGQQRCAPAFRAPRRSLYGQVRRTTLPRAPSFPS
ncbi:hypothetical protein CG723_27815 [Streptomyces sp. CB01635]|nr:hypothetical protein CG723_27815 [Streptomyces sp. CB01635]